MVIERFASKIFVSFLEAIPILLMYLKIVQKEYYLKKHKGRMLLFVIMHAVFASWAFISFPKGEHTIAIIGSLIIVLSILTSTLLKHSVIAVLISIIYILSIELVCISIFSMCVGENSILLLNNIKADIIFSIVLNFVRLVVLAIIYKVNISFIKLNSRDEEDTITSYWILGIAIMLVYISSMNIIISNKVNIVLYQVILIFMFMFFVIIGIVDYKKRIDLNKIRNKFELKKEYANNLESIIDIIRREKHDFANHINTIYAMCVLNKPNTLEHIKEYLQRTTNNLESSYKFFDTGNNYIDGLIAMKSNYALENDIYLDVEFDESLEVVRVEDNDLVGIISNILDNAFQAFNQGNHEGKKIVSTYGYVEDNKYYLCIANNGPMIPNESAKKIFEKGFSTKKNQKKDHGFGLYIVRNLVRKNGGNISLISSSKETEFLIEFQLKEEYYRKTLNENLK
ncbi:sensor histidine kinase [Clostridium brassicae]|uniref:sensor histidine kinase n=1 Tax=Clostridium brassicae TaxID=2999072 RepID=UPI00227D204A|nr:ATP-binding protein [Clostridium brassicae]